ncbi:type II toxin-antitoxin system BrnA family antitoxin [Adlercreutzia sp. ZJ473]|uniref:type II toxin-antitoxin system BrnA family antitoxin n=1 Tax=Adlercreutzia sp. ZJ473 TaxID=2722822 RepID=UPI0020A6BEB5|nr:BrnA antitoxin family protein [Adlercreutzia sp. ZJ473]
MTANATSDRGLEAMFDEGTDMTEFIIDEKTRFPGQDDAARKINISMPEWMISELDATARHHAVSRQAVINLWIGERLAEEKRALA